MQEFVKSLAIGLLSLREHLTEKNRFLSGIVQITSPPSPQFGQVVQLFLDVKNDVFARSTEPSNDDYDNDVSDNCDNYFGTFDDFGVKNDQKVSHYMILMSKYKGQHGGKKGKKIRARPSPHPPPFRAMPERNRFLLWEVFPKHILSSCSMLQCPPLALVKGSL